jgi:hypothetical protein
MKSFLTSILIIFIASIGYGQSTVPSKKELKKVKVDPSYDASLLFEKHPNWEYIGFYDYKRREYTLSDTFNEITFVNKTIVNWITPNDKLTFLSKNQFEIIYGGSGPERQEFNIITMIGNYLIVESKDTNKGYVNGKLAFKQKKKVRYIWKVKSNS